MNRSPVRRLPAVALLTLALGSAAHARADGPIVVDTAGARFELYLHEAPADFDPTPLVDWLTDAANTVSRYYGRFPASPVRVDLDLFPGGGTVGGSASGDEGARIAVTVGGFSSPAELARDWRLVHEMIHLALPRLPRAHHWLVEGLPTYLESISRARHGKLDDDFIWRGFLRGMPHGLPRGTEAGLDGSTRWGRVYWGGALFCLYADIGIRRATNNERSLRDAVRAIVDAGHDLTDKAELEPLLSIADRATGTTVLTELYRVAGLGRWAPDLKALWRALGVELSGDAVVYDDDAPLAAVRRAITMDAG